MLERTDLVVVGAGPAGLCAAIEAARAGVRVVVVDENPRPGGQIFRQLPGPFRATNTARMRAEFRRGRALLSQLEGLPIRVLSNAIAWGSFDDRVLEVSHEGLPLQVAAQAIVLATGAYDRPVPIPGWTLPGVLTVGGAQTILKSQRILPGCRIFMAGTGPLQLVVASQLARAGADLVAVADPVATWHVLQHVPALLRAWSITRDGLAYRWSLVRARVPWLTPYVLVRIEGRDEVESATIVRVDDEWRPIPGTERTFEVDTVCVGYGLVPSIELPRLLGCRLLFDPLAAVWIPERSSEFETSVANVYAVGDGAGVAGAVVAAEEGRIAGLSVAQRLGRLTPADARRRGAPARARLRSLQSFRTAMDSVYRVKSGLHELASDETFVCRCEERTAGDFRAAVRDGARTLDHLKAWTRGGMGPCGGRMCGLPTAHLLARELGVDVAIVGCYRPRPPIKPVPIAAMIGGEPG
jgi:NADPH-dependent 2,4-dienoyl-CoA reductase/sulfur reductase-like enzyme